MAAQRQLQGANPVAFRINSLAKRLDSLNYADAELRGIINSLHHSWDMKLAAGAVLEERQAQMKSMVSKHLE